MNESPERTVIVPIEFDCTKLFLSGGTVNSLPWRNHNARTVLLECLSTERIYDEEHDVDKWLVRYRLRYSHVEAAKGLYEETDFNELSELFV